MKKGKEGKSEKKTARTEKKMDAPRVAINFSV